MSILHSHTSDTTWPKRDYVAAVQTGVAYSRIVLIDSQALFRGCLENLLKSWMPDIEVECARCSGEVSSGPALLALIGIDPCCDCTEDNLRDCLHGIRLKCEDAPVGVFLRGENPVIAKRLAMLGVSGIVSPAASMELAIAAVNLMLVGGTFLPLEVFRQEEVATSLQREPQTPLMVVAANASEGLRNGAHLHPSLTSREADVLIHLRSGKQNKNIAYELGISESTVKVHLRNLMKKLHASNRTQAALGVGA